MPLERSGSSIGETMNQIKGRVMLMGEGRQYGTDHISGEVCCILIGFVASNHMV